MKVTSATSRDNLGRTPIAAHPRLLTGTALATEWDRTAKFAALVGPQAFRRGLITARRTLHLRNHDGAAELIGGDPILVRLLVYVFHPRRWCSAVWILLRQFD